MKLRKAAKKELLDLDDPLETASNDSDHETGDYERLSDIAEGYEEEDCEQNSEGEAGGGDDEEDGDTVHVDASDDDSELAGAPGQDEPKAAGVRFGNHTESGSDAWDEDADQQEDEQKQEVAEEEDDDDGGGGGTTGLVRVAFNPFDLLSEDCDASGSGSGSEGEGENNRAVSAASASQASTQYGDARGGGAGAGSADGSRPAERRRRRQRKNPRRRRRCGAAHSSSVAAAEECVVAADAAAEAAEVPEAVAEAAASQAPERDCEGSPCHSAAPDGEDRSCPESGTDDVAGDTACSDSDGEEGVADCWLCFGEGRVARDGARGGAGCGRGCGGCGNSGCTAAGGDDGGGTDSELVAPCRTCAGGLRYIHRSCFESWMKSSWALACPNCRQLYDSAVLDDFTTAASVPSMLLASFPPDHDLQQPLPPFAHVQFCVGGMVELSMACGGFTPVGLLRHMRSFVDDMMRRGGDGGLGLVVDGRPLQLPGFNVTGLVLDLGPSGSGSTDPWVDSWPPSLMPDDGYSNDEEDDDAYPEGEGPASSFRRGAASATDPRDAAYEDSDAEQNSGDGDEPSGRGLGGAAADLDALAWEMLRWSRPPTPPPVLREHSFTSGSGSGRGRDLLRRLVDGLMQPAPPLLRDLRPRLNGPSGEDPGGNGDRAVRGNVVRHVLEWQRPPAVAAAPVEELPLPVPLPPWRNDAERRASAMRSAAERAVLRAEQQRRRADLLLQQRNQQRYAGGSRGQQAMSGTPRGGGGGRRR